MTTNHTFDWHRAVVKNKVGLYMATNHTFDWHRAVVKYKVGL